MRSIVLACFILFISIDNLQAQTENLGLLKVEDIWSNGKLWARTSPGFNSMNDGLRYTNSVDNADGSKDVIIYDYKTGKEKQVLINGSELVLPGGSILKYSDYHFNSTETSVILETSVVHIDRFSKAADFYIYDLVSKTLQLLSKQGKQRYAEYSPDGKMIAFFRENNLYVKVLDSGKEIAVTKDGQKNRIINGAGDWVYSEEFAVERAYRWSPDSKRIAYMRFDETEVKDFTYMRYDSLYPTPITFKYPKAGEKNSIVSVHVFDLTTEKSTKMNVGENVDQYIPRIKWTNDPEQLSIFRLNRHQNKLELILANSSDGNSKVILTEENETFLEIDDDLDFLEDGKKFVWTSTRDGYNHIYLMGMEGNVIKQITKGNWDVTQFYGFDSKSNLFYYQSAENSSTQRQVYSINLNGEKTLLSYKDGVNTAEFSSTFKYFMLVYSTTSTPFISTIRDSKGKDIRVLNDNKLVKERLAAFKLSKKEFFEFTTDDGISLKGWMIKPAEFQSRERYPVLMHVYGGPGSQAVVNQTVMDQWENGDYLWHQLLAQKGYIVVSVDNRGTGARGLEFNSCIYGRMGELETNDQLQVIKYLSNLPYVDSERIGVQGWSFGGYLTGLLMTKGNGVIKAGIAVAPITNWRYYDSVYIERYLKTPLENPAGYDQNSPITFAKDLKGKLLLMHGSGDDNVHYQNTLMFTNELIKYNKQFEQFIYPNRDHNIGGGGARLHIYTKMTDFIIKNL